MEKDEVNSGFFHACVRRRSKRNNLIALRVGEIWLDKVYDVRGEITWFFQDQFTDSEVVRPNLDRVSLSTISSSEVESLSDSFLPFKLNDVVAEIDGTKNLGLDGFNFSFCKKCWG